jgi:hypothetical protein
MTEDIALQRFFADPLIAARCAQCGQLVAVYGSDRWFTEDRCRCDPVPRLPDGADLAALVRQAEARPHVSPHRARMTIRV